LSIFFRLFIFSVYFLFKWKKKLEMHVAKAQLFYINFCTFLMVYEPHKSVVPTNENHLLSKKAQLFKALPDIILWPYWSRNKTTRPSGPRMRWVTNSGTHHAAFNTCHLIILPWPIWSSYNRVMIRISFPLEHLYTSSPPPLQNS